MNSKILLFLIAIIALFGGYFIWNKYYKSTGSNTSTPTNSITISSTSTPSSTPTNKETITTYQVPILMYHYVRDFNDPSDKVGTNLSVSPKALANQLEWLKSNGYQTVNPDYLINPYKMDSKPIILTFDDGYRDAYTDAYPILKKYDSVATFYIITDYINKGNSNYVSWDMVQEMKKGNMNFGSHTLTHPDLEKCTTDRVNRELRDSKKLIEDKIGSAVTDFCYPSGKYNQEIITQVESAGYKTATTVKNGVADQDSELFELPRIRVQDDTNLESRLK